MDTQRSNTQLATWPRVCLCVCPGCIQSSTRSEYRLVGTAGVHNPAPTVVVQLPRHAKAVGTSHPYIYHNVSMRAYVRQHSQQTRRPTTVTTVCGNICWGHCQPPAIPACNLRAGQRVAPGHPLPTLTLMTARRATPPPRATTCNTSTTHGDNHAHIGVGVVHPLGRHHMRLLVWARSLWAVGRLSEAIGGHRHATSQTTTTAP